MHAVAEPPLGDPGRLSGLDWCASTEKYYVLELANDISVGKFALTKQQLSFAPLQ